jgi:hypothetical protein
MPSSQPRQPSSAALGDQNKPGCAVAAGWPPVRRASRECEGTGSGYGHGGDTWASSSRPVKRTISVSDVQKLDVRVGTIVAVDELSKSSKLLKLTVDFGDHRRTFPCQEQRGGIPYLKGGIAVPGRSLSRCNREQNWFADRYAIHGSRAEPDKSSRALETIRSCDSGKAWAGPDWEGYRVLRRLRRPQKQ